jgi:hypothetical protein
MCCKIAGVQSYDVAGAKSYNSAGAEKPEFAQHCQRLSSIPD